MERATYLSRLEGENELTCFVHQTDIFHPHGDPDDHYDLATVYALAAQGKLHLKGVMFDFPPGRRLGDPATLAMAQLGYLTGITGIPFAIGSMHPLTRRTDDLRNKPKGNRAAAEWLCRVLEENPEPIAVNIVGSCTDVALAGLLRPELFESKCKGIYLNAGAAHPSEKAELEYNVKLNPGSYAAIFDLPCPVYWCPCWHKTDVFEIGANGTWYSFKQDEVFANTSDSLCNFFLYMLSRSPDPRYLRFLHQAVDPHWRKEFGSKNRNMWSTAPILHAAGMGIDMQRGLMLADEIKEPLFDFAPITVKCSDEGHTNWELSEEGSGRYIFRIHEPAQYKQTMTSALASLLSTIGS